MTHAILTTVSERPGMLYAITKVLADHAADIKYVDIHGGESQLCASADLSSGQHELHHAVRVTPVRDG